MVMPTTSSEVKTILIGPLSALCEIASLVRGPFAELGLVEVEVFQLGYAPLNLD